MADEKSPLYHMLQLGFKVDATCQTKKVPADGKVKLYKLTAMDDNMATLKPTGIDEDFPSFIVTLHHLKESWRTTVIKPQTALDFKEWTPEKSLQWHIDFVKSHTMMALSTMSGKVAEEKIFEHLQLYVNPNAVKATHGFPVGKLVLVPCTRTIKDRPADEECPDKHIDLGILIKEPVQVSFSLVPLTVHSKPTGNFVAPFWFVPTSASEEGNMKLGEEKFDISVLIDTKLQVHTKMSIPVMRNCCVIKKGDLLSISAASVSSSPKKAKMRKQ